MVVQIANVAAADAMSWPSGMGFGGTQQSGMGAAAGGYAAAPGTYGGQQQEAYTYGGANAYSQYQQQAPQQNTFGQAQHGQPAAQYQQPPVQTGPFGQVQAGGGQSAYAQPASTAYGAQPGYAQTAPTAYDAAAAQQQGMGAAAGAAGGYGAAQGSHGAWQASQQGAAYNYAYGQTPQAQPYATQPQSQAAALPYPNHPPPSMSAPPPQGGSAYGGSYSVPPPSVSSVPSASSAPSTHSASAQPAASQGGDAGYVHCFCCARALLPAFGVLLCARYYHFLRGVFCPVLWMRICVPRLPLQVHSLS